MPLPFSLAWGGGHIVSPLSICTFHSVRSILPLYCSPYYQTSFKLTGLLIQEKLIQYTFSRWRPSWNSKQNDFSLFDQQATLTLSMKFIGQFFFVFFVVFFCCFLICNFLFFFFFLTPLQFLFQTRVISKRGSPVFCFFHLSNMCTTLLFSSTLTVWSLSKT